MSGKLCAMHLYTSKVDLHEDASAKIEALRVALEVNVAMLEELAGVTDEHDTHSVCMHLARISNNALCNQP